MAEYLTPGVYYERADAGAPGITAVRTDVAGFVGIAPMGLVDTAVPMESFRQYQAHFGGFTGAGFLAYAVRAFFENGGRRCWVVRVASDDPGGGAAPATAVVGSDPPGRDVWRISAWSPGVWGNDLSVRLQEIGRAQAVTIPAPGTPNRSSVSSTNGFERATLVRLRQAPLPPVYKVISAVDPVSGELVWFADDAEMRLPYDAPLAGFDPDREIVVESVEYSILVRRAGIPVALYRNLSLIPEHPRYGPDMLAPLTIPRNSGAARVLPPVPQAIVIEELRHDYQPGTDPAFPKTIDTLSLPAAAVELTGGVDGLRLLTAYDFVGEPFDPAESDLARKLKTRGLRALAEVNEIGMVAIPDIQIQPIDIPPTYTPPPCVPDPCLPTEPAAPPAAASPVNVMELPPVFTDADIYRVQAAMVDDCDLRRDRVALLDPPFDAARNDALGTGAARVWRNRFDSKYAAFYYPWLRVVDPLLAATALTRDIPPCGHVAGQYARAEITVGVHRAPANAELAWVQDVTVPVGDAQHGVLNPLGINAIRPLRGRGIRIMGARTVSSDPSWVFVSVRRLLISIEKAIYRSLQWAVFEPNDHLTRAKVRLSITSFLVSLWQRGALAGDTAEAAFRVKCDDENNRDVDRANGRLLAEVGVAPSYPFEFVVLRVGRAGNEFKISEQSGGIF